jgi:hypothetical protein
MSLMKNIWRTSQHPAAPKSVDRSRCPTSVFNTIEEFWNDNRLLAAALLLVGIGLAIRAGVKTPSPGIAIGLLALAAGVMSVRPRMHLLEKLGWVCVLIAFSVIEVHAIHVSDENSRVARERQNAEFAADRNRQNIAFQDIADGLKATLILSKEQYSSTITHVEKVLKTTNTVSKLTEKNLQNITGGNSNASFEFVYLNGVIPQLWIRNTGKYPMRNLSVQIEDVNRLENLIASRAVRKITMEDLHDSEQDIKIGDLGIQQLLSLPAASEAHGEDLVHYLIHYSALNGGGMTVIYVRVGKDGKKHMASWSGGTNDNGTRKVEDGFPPDATGKLPWLGTNP